MTRHLIFPPSVPLLRSCYFTIVSTRNHSFFHFSMLMQKYIYMHTFVPTFLFVLPLAFFHTSQYIRTIYQKIQQWSKVEESNPEGCTFTRGWFFTSQQMTPPSKLRPLPLEDALHQHFSYKRLETDIQRMKYQYVLPMKTI